MTGTSQRSAIPVRFDRLWPMFLAAREGGRDFERGFTAWLLAGALPPLAAALVSAYAPGISREGWIARARERVVGTPSSFPSTGT